MSGRLSISTALSRNTSLDSSYAGRSDTTSASVAQAEREIKVRNFSLVVYKFK
jgi:hypothetical protein